MHFAQPLASYVEKGCHCYLASEHGESSSGIGKLFGVSANTIPKCTWKFVRAIIEGKFQPFHQVAYRGLSQEVKADFVVKGFPNCCGAIEGMHLPIELPRGENSMHSAKLVVDR